ncbi:Peptidase M15 [Brevinema andersonii]|uniref:Peptidase M15 n=1 Tax=Brevinema andersonii TaxID=34097 RepID=A0A1I1F8S8_BREAD|nr:D-Ala-D-Ala carboxypeptidase family metallohydrolase [Brevinema andersonii]SFB93490.1 Peptidase M15 [Brevinema andersonii]
MEKEQLEQALSQDMKPYQKVLQEYGAERSAEAAKTGDAMQNAAGIVNQGWYYVEQNEALQFPYTFEETTEKYGIENLATNEMVDNLIKLTELVLDPLREQLEKPIILTCYRSKEINTKISSCPDSHHTYGCTADNICLKKDQDQMMQILRKI